MLKYVINPSTKISKIMYNNKFHNNISTMFYISRDNVIKKKQLLKNQFINL